MPVNIVSNPRSFFPVGLLMPAEGFQYGAEVFDGIFVRNAVGGEYAVVILDVGDVVSHRRSEKVGQFPTGLFENYLWSAGIPDLCPRAWVNIDVTRPFGDQADL